MQIGGGGGGGGPNSVGGVVGSRPAGPEPQVRMLSDADFPFSPQLVDFCKSAEEGMIAEKLVVVGDGGVGKF